jgi:ribosomal subunit interface protein
MEIQFRGHQTDISDGLRIRAAEGAHKLAAHLGRPVDADVCFAEDGVKKTVELVLHAPNYKKLVATGEGKYHEPALSEAIAKLDGQIRRLKSARKKSFRGPELRA